MSPTLSVKSRVPDTLHAYFATNGKTVNKVYNWNDLPREIVREGVERCGFRGENVIAVMNWIAPNIAINPHSHNFEQLVFCIQGSFNYHVDDEIHLMTPGSMLRVPAHTLHYIEPIGETVALNLDIFAPPRADYLHLVDYQAEDFVMVGESSSSMK